MLDCDTLADRGFAPVAVALAAQRIPGAVLGVLTAQGRAIRFGGYAQLTPQKRLISSHTQFDLASLTKVLFTTHRLLKLVEQGRVGLDDPLSSVIPDLRQYDVSSALERSLTFRQCLSHATHLPAVEPLYTYGQNPATLRAFILQRAWRAGPPVYSDINFLLLGIALERLLGSKLQELDPGFGFTFHPDAAQTAATEYCTWRERVMLGEVHDENAFAMGGAAGHAGLFGSVSAVLDYAEGVLRGQSLTPKSLAEIRRRHSDTRTLGWQAAHPGWSGGAVCSDETIGHTGFTGTGIWIDWQREQAWTLLTNRVHPSRHHDSGIAALRRAVGEAVCQ